MAVGEVHNSLPRRARGVESCGRGSCAKSESARLTSLQNKTWRTFGIFFSFFRGWEKGGGVRGETGGTFDVVLIEKGGGFLRSVGGVVHNGAGRVLRGVWGLNIVFWTEMSTKKSTLKMAPTPRPATVLQ